MREGRGVAGLLRVLWFPYTVQRHAGLNGDSILTVDVKSIM